MKYKTIEKKLFEAVEVEGAEYIGSGDNFDLFRITSWEAAQSFVLQRDQNRHAGDQFTQNETTFNNNINDSLRLYFYTILDTNQVVSAVIKSDNESGTVNIDGVNVRINCQYEDANQRNNIGNLNIPLYFIPGLRIEGDLDIGAVIQDNILYGLFPQLKGNQTDIIVTYEVPEIVERITTNAFNHGNNIETVVINHMLNLDERCFNHVSTVKIHSNISIEFADRYTNGNIENASIDDASIEFAYDLSEEERENFISNIIERQANERAEQERAEQERLEAERLEQERMERERIERERLEQERKEREEAERIERERQDRLNKQEKVKERNQKLCKDFYIKEVGNEAHIFGLRSNLKNGQFDALDNYGILTIPSYYKDKPITEIEPFAFYGKGFIRKVNIPNTIRKIGDKAFLNTAVSVETLNFWNNKSCTTGMAMEPNESSTYVTPSNEVTDVNNKLKNKIKFGVKIINNPNTRYVMKWQ